MRTLVLAGLALVELHGPQGQRILVNPPEITSVREPRGLDSGHWARGTKCLLLMADGRIITVVDDCDTVREKLER